jgi:hypothetical protein
MNWMSPGEQVHQHVVARVLGHLLDGRSASSARREPGRIGWRCDAQMYGGMQRTNSRSIPLGEHGQRVVGRCRPRLLAAEVVRELS